MNTKISAILISLFLIYSSITHAETTDDGKPIYYCPKSIICDTANEPESCHASDDGQNIWSISVGNFRYFPRGEYKLNNVILANSEYTYGQFGFVSYISCSYTINEKQTNPFMITPKLFNAFKPLEREGSKWRDTHVNNYPGKTCQSSNPKDCPFIEYPAIKIQNQPYMGFSFYYKTLDNFGFYPPFSSSTVLTYNQLTKLCGITSYCIMDISGSSEQSIGQVILDLSYPDEINFISANFTDPHYEKYYQIKKHPIFNILSVEDK